VRRGVRARWRDGAVRRRFTCASRRRLAAGGSRRLARAQWFFARSRQQTSAYDEFGSRYAHVTELMATIKHLKADHLHGMAPPPVRRDEREVQRPAVRTQVWGGRRAGTGPRATRSPGVRLPPTPRGRLGRYCRSPLAVETVSASRSVRAARSGCSRMCSTSNGAYVSFATRMWTGGSARGRADVAGPARSAQERR
jgi:hypothetical protein